MRVYIAIIAILISCVFFFLGGLFIGFRKGDSYRMDVMEREAIAQKSGYKASEKPSKPIIGVPMKSKRISRGIFSGSREVSDAARKRIEDIKIEDSGD